MIVYITVTHLNRQLVEPGDEADMGSESIADELEGYEARIKRFDDAWRRKTEEENESWKGHWLNNLEPKIRKSRREELSPGQKAQHVRTTYQSIASTVSSGMQLANMPYDFGAKLTHCDLVGQPELLRDARLNRTCPGPLDKRSNTLLFQYQPVASILLSTTDCETSEFFCPGPNRRDRVRFSTPRCCRTWKGSVEVYHGIDRSFVHLH